MGRVRQLEFIESQAESLTRRTIQPVPSMGTMPASVDFETAEAVLFPSELDEGQFTDGELTVLALAADPDQLVDSDAIPFTIDTAGGDQLLPLWYMPAPMARTRSRRQTAIAVVVVVAFLLIEALGLCVTYGQLVVA